MKKLLSICLTTLSLYAIDFTDSKDVGNGFLILANKDFCSISSIGTYSSIEAWLQGTSSRLQSQYGNISKDFTIMSKTSAFSLKIGNETILMNSLKSYCSLNPEDLRSLLVSMFFRIPDGFPQARTEDEKMKQRLYNFQKWIKEYPTIFQTYESIPIFYITLYNKMYKGTAESNKEAEEIMISFIKGDINTLKANLRSPKIQAYKDYIDDELLK